MANKVRQTIDFGFEQALKDALKLKKAMGSIGDEMSPDAVNQVNKLTNKMQELDEAVSMLQDTKLDKTALEEYVKVVSKGFAQIKESLSATNNLLQSFKDMEWAKDFVGQFEVVNNSISQTNQNIEKFIQNEQQIGRISSNIMQTAPTSDKKNIEQTLKDDQKRADAINNTAKALLQEEQTRQDLSKSLKKQAEDVRALTGALEDNNREAEKQVAYLERVRVEAKKTLDVLNKAKDEEYYWDMSDDNIAKYEKQAKDSGAEDIAAKNKAIAADIKTNVQLASRAIQNYKELYVQLQKTPDLFDATQILLDMKEIGDKLDDFVRFGDEFFQIPSKDFLNQVDVALKDDIDVISGDLIEIEQGLTEHFDTINKILKEESATVVENYMTQIHRFLTDLDVSTEDKNEDFFKKIKVSAVLNPKSKKWMTDKLVEIIKEIEDSDKNVLSVPVAFTSKYATKRKLEIYQQLQEDFKKYSDQLAEKSVLTQKEKKTQSAIAEGLMNQLQEELKKWDNPELKIETNIEKLQQEVPDAIKFIKEAINNNLGVEKGEDPLTLDVKLNTDVEAIQEALTKMSVDNDFSLTISSLEFSDNLMQSINSLDRMLEKRKKDAEEAAKKGLELPPLNIYETMSEDEVKQVKRLQTLLEQIMKINNVVAKLRENAGTLPVQMVPTFNATQIQEELDNISKDAGLGITVSEVRVQDGILVKGEELEVKTLNLESDDAYKPFLDSLGDLLGNFGMQLEAIQRGFEALKSAPITVNNPWIQNPSNISGAQTEGFTPNAIGDVLNVALQNTAKATEKLADAVEQEKGSTAEQVADFLKQDNQEQAEAVQENTQAINDLTNTVQQSSEKGSTSEQIAEFLNQSAEEQTKVTQQNTEAVDKLNESLKDEHGSTQEQMDAFFEGWTDAKEKEAIANEQAVEVSQDALEETKELTEEEESLVEARENANETVKEIKENIDRTSESTSHANEELETFYQTVDQIAEKCLRFTQEYKTIASISERYRDLGEQYKDILAQGGELYTQLQNAKAEKQAFIEPYMQGKKIDEEYYNTLAQIDQKIANIEKQREAFDIKGKLNAIVDIAEKGFISDKQVDKPGVRNFARQFFGAGGNTEVSKSFDAWAYSRQLPKREYDILRAEVMTEYDKYFKESQGATFKTAFKELWFKKLLPVSKISNFSKYSNIYAKNAAMVEDLNLATQSMGALTIEEYNKFLEAQDFLASKIPELRKREKVAGRRKKQVMRTADNQHMLLDISIDENALTGDRSVVEQIEEQIKEKLNKKVSKGIAWNDTNYAKLLPYLQIAQVLNVGVEDLFANFGRKQWNRKDKAFIDSIYDDIRIPDITKILLEGMGKNVGESELDSILAKRDAKDRPAKNSEAYLKQLDEVRNRIAREWARNMSESQIQKLLSQNLEDFSEGLFNKYQDVIKYLSTTVSPIQSELLRPRDLFASSGYKPKLSKRQQAIRDMENMPVVKKVEENNLEKLESLAWDIITIKMTPDQPLNDDEMKDYISNQNEMIRRINVDTADRFSKESWKDLKDRLNKVAEDFQSFYKKYGENPEEWTKGAKGIHDRLVNKQTTLQESLKEVNKGRGELLRAITDKKKTSSAKQRLYNLQSDEEQFQMTYQTMSEQDFQELLKLIKDKKLPNISSLYGDEISNPNSELNKLRIKYIDDAIKGQLNRMTKGDTGAVTRKHKEGAGDSITNTKNNQPALRQLARYLLKYNLGFETPEGSEKFRKQYGLNEGELDVVKEIYSQVKKETERQNLLDEYGRLPLDQRVKRMAEQIKKEIKGRSAESSQTEGAQVALDDFIEMFMGRGGSTKEELQQYSSQFNFTQTQLNAIMRKYDEVDKQREEEAAYMEKAAEEQRKKLEEQYEERQKKITPEQAVLNMFRNLSINQEKRTYDYEGTLEFLDKLKEVYEDTYAEQLSSEQYGLSEDVVKDFLNMEERRNVVLTDEQKQSLEKDAELIRQFMLEADKINVKDGKYLYKYSNEEKVGALQKKIEALLNAQKAIDSYTEIYKKITGLPSSSYEVLRDVSPDSASLTSFTSMWNSFDEYASTRDALQKGIEVALQKKVSNTLKNTEKIIGDALNNISFSEDGKIPVDLQDTNNADVFMYQGKIYDDEAKAIQAQKDALSQAEEAIEQAKQMKADAEQAIEKAKILVANAPKVDVRDYTKDFKGETTITDVRKSNAATDITVQSERTADEMKAINASKALDDARTMLKQAESSLTSATKKADDLAKQTIVKGTENIEAVNNAKAIGTIIQQLSDASSIIDVDQVVSVDYLMDKFGLSKQKATSLKKTLGSRADIEKNYAHGVTVAPKTTEELEKIAQDKKYWDTLNAETELFKDIQEALNNFNFDESSLEYLREVLKGVEGFNPSEEFSAKSLLNKWGIEDQSITNRRRELRGEIAEKESIIAEYSQKYKGEPGKWRGKGTAIARANYQELLAKKQELEELDVNNIYYIQNLEDALKNFELIGNEANAGLVQGLEETLPQVEEAANKVGDTATTALKDNLEIHSPSVKWFQIGENAIEGLYNGLSETIRQSVTLDEFKKGVEKINAIFSNNPWDEKEQQFYSVDFEKMKDDAQKTYQILETMGYGIGDRWKFFEDFLGEAANTQWSNAFNGISSYTGSKETRVHDLYQGLKTTLSGDLPYYFDETRTFGGMHRNEIEEMYNYIEDKLNKDEKPAEGKTEERIEQAIEKAEETIEQAVSESIANQIEDEAGSTAQQIADFFGDNGDAPKTENAEIQDVLKEETVGLQDFVELTTQKVKEQLGKVLGEEVDIPEEIIQQQVNAALSATESSLADTSVQDDNQLADSIGQFTDRFNELQASIGNKKGIWEKTEQNMQYIDTLLQFLYSEGLGTTSTLESILDSVKIEDKNREILKQRDSELKSGAASGLLSQLVFTQGGALNKNKKTINQEALNKIGEAYFKYYSDITPMGVDEFAKYLGLKPNIGIDMGKRNIIEQSLKEYRTAQIKAQKEAEKKLREERKKSSKTKSDGGSTQAQINEFLGETLAKEEEKEKKRTSSRKKANKEVHEEELKNIQEEQKASEKSVKKTEKAKKVSNYQAFKTRLKMLNEDTLSSGKWREKSPEEKNRIEQLVHEYRKSEYYDNADQDSAIKQFQKDFKISDTNLGVFTKYLNKLEEQIKNGLVEEVDRRSDERDAAIVQLIDDITKVSNTDKWSESPSNNKNIKNLIEAFGKSEFGLNPNVNEGAKAFGELYQLDATNQGIFEKYLSKYQDSLAKAEEKAKAVAEKEEQKKAEQEKKRQEVETKLQDELDQIFKDDAKDSTVTKAVSEIASTVKTAAGRVDSQTLDKFRELASHIARNDKGLFSKDSSNKANIDELAKEIYELEGTSGRDAMDEVLHRVIGEYDDIFTIFERIKVLQASRRRQIEQLLSETNKEGGDRYSKEYINTGRSILDRINAGQFVSFGETDQYIYNKKLYGSEAVNQRTLNKLLIKAQKLSGSNFINRETRDELEALIYDMQQLGKDTNASNEEVNEFVLRLQQLEQEAAKTGKTLWGQIGQRLQDMNAKFIASYLSFQDITRYIRTMIDTVTELDTALTEMRKVSDESVASLKEYQKTTFDTASALGTTAVQLQQSTADWMRLGETLEEASKSSVAATTLLNVSEFDNINDATTALVAMSQAYKDLDKTEIIDVLNNIGNNYSIATDQLATALQASSAALMTQGNDLYEAAALVTAGNAVIQDASKVGTGIRTISLRIAGMKMGKEELEEELAELGEEVDDWVVQTESKKREVIKAYTATEDNQEGVDILDANGNLKDTYHIMLEISKVYAKIQEEDKKYGTNRAQALVEELAGKVRSNIAASILMNPELLENVYNSAIDSAGSAAEENAKYLDSIVGKTQQFKNELQELEFTLANSDTIKTTIDLGTNLLSLLNEFIKKVPIATNLIVSMAAALVAAQKQIFFHKDAQGNTGGIGQKMIDTLLSPFSKIKSDNSVSDEVGEIVEDIFTTDNTQEMAKKIGESVEDTIESGIRMAVNDVDAFDDVVSQASQSIAEDIDDWSGKIWDVQSGENVADAIIPTDTIESVDDRFEQLQVELRDRVGSPFEGIDFTIFSDEEVQKMKDDWDNVVLGEDTAQAIKERATDVSDTLSETLAVPLNEVAESTALEDLNVQYDQLTGSVNNLTVSTEILDAADMEEAVAANESAVANNMYASSVNGADAANRSAINSTNALTTAVTAEGTANEATATAISLKNAALTFGITLAIQGIIKLISYVSKSKQRIEEAGDIARRNIEEINRGLDDTSNTVEKAGKRYAELSQKVGNLGKINQNQGGLSNEEYKEFLDVSNQLANVFPTLQTGFTESNGAILDLNGSASEITATLEHLLEVEKELANEKLLSEAGDVFKDNLKDYNDIVKEPKFFSFTTTEYNEAVREYENAQEFLRSGLYNAIIRGGTVDSGTKSLTESLGGINAARVDEVLTKALGIKANSKEYYDLIDKISKSNSLDRTVNWLAGTGYNVDRGYDFSYLDEQQRERIQAYYTDLVNTYERELNIAQSEIDKINADNRKYMSAALKDSVVYGTASAETQQLMEAVLSTFDMSQIPADIKKSKDWTQFIAWFNATYMDAISQLDDEELSDAMAQVFNDATLNAADKVDLIGNIIKSLTGSVETGGHGFDAGDPLVVYWTGQYVEAQNKKEAVIDTLYSGMVHSNRNDVDVSDKLNPYMTEADRNQLYIQAMRDADRAKAEQWVSQLSNDEITLLLEKGVNPNLFNDLQDVKDYLEEVKKSMYKLDDFESLLYSNSFISEDMQKRFDALENEYEKELALAKTYGAEFDRAVYGNINLENREALVWDYDTLQKSKRAIESYGNSIEDYADSLSTVDAMSAEFDGVEIAFSPILQTPNGPEYLDKDTVYNYINSLISQMPEGFTDEDLFKLDAQGLEIEGKKIQGLIAAVGDEAIRVGETMHYLGENGSLDILGDQMEEFKNSHTTWSSIRRDLIGLAQAGKLDETTLKQYEWFNDMIQALGISAEDADDYLSDMVNYINQIAVKNPVDDLANFRTEMDKLGDAYAKYQNGEFIDANTLSALQDAFGDLDSYQDFEKAVLTGDSNLQRHFDNIVSEYAYEHNIMGQLTEDQKDYYKQMLIRSGVTEQTADAAVKAALEEKKALELRIEGVLDSADADDVKTAKLKELVLGTKELDQATIKEVNDLIVETGLTGESAEMVKYYAIQKDLAKHKDLRNADDINYLLQVCELAGIASTSLQSLKHLSDNKGVFEKAIQDADAAMNKFRDANGKIRQNLTYGEQQELNSIVNRKEVAQSALNQMGKLAEQAWDETYSGFQDKFSQYEYKPNLDYGGLVDDASSAGSDAAEAYKDALDKILALYDAELDAGVISFQTYVDKSRAIIEQYYKDGKITAQEYYDELSDFYSKQVTQYDKVISAVQKSLQDEQDALEKQKENIEKSYNEQIEVIQKKIDALQDENDEIDRNMELSKAQ